MNYTKQINTKTLIYNFYQKLLELYNTLSEEKMTRVMKRLVDVLSEEVSK